MLIVVSTAVVLKQPGRLALDLKRNILMAAGLLDPALSVEEQFEQVETRVVSLDEGQFVEAWIRRVLSARGCRTPLNPGYSR